MEVENHTKITARLILMLLYDGSRSLHSIHQLINNGLYWRTNKSHIGHILTEFVYEGLAYQIFTKSDFSNESHMITYCLTEAGENTVQLLLKTSLSPSLINYTSEVTAMAWFFNENYFSHLLPSLVKRRFNLLVKSKLPIDNKEKLLISRQIDLIDADLKFTNEIIKYHSYSHK